MSAEFAPEYRARFWQKVSRVAETACWEWRAGKNREGYGWARGPDGRNSNAHRLAFQMEVGPIAEGLVVDHLCRNRACVNPTHLEPVTPGENARRGQLGLHSRARAAAQTHCVHGHEYTPENTYRTPSTGRRLCQQCKRRHNMVASAQRTEARRQRSGSQ